MRATNWLRTLYWYLGGLSIILATLGCLAGIGYAKYLQVQQAMSMPAPPEMPVAVGLAEAKEVRFSRSSVVVGTVFAARSVRLRTELSGLVTEVPMEVGQRVDKGEVLVQMDVRTENAELKSALASLKLARADLVRLQSMARSNAISAQEAETAEANVIRCEADVDRLNVLIDRKTLRAPFDARVGLFQLHEGQYLDAGTEITTLEGIDNYYDIDFSVPKHVAETLNVDDEVRLEMTYSSDRFQPNQRTVKVIAIDSKADAISRTVLARARIYDPPSTMRPNDSVRIVVDYGAPVDAIAVPATAIRRGPAGATVFVVVEKEGQLRAESRNVLLAGSGNGTTAWIAMGVRSGEQVVAEGSFKLREGALLTPVEIDRPDVPGDALIAPTLELGGE